MVVYRLDKETSGILVLARTPPAHQQLSLQFERRQVAKRYQALMSGEPDWEHWEVCAPLRKDGDRRRRIVVDTQRGKTSHTELNVLERYRGFALVEAIPHTVLTWPTWVSPSWLMACMAMALRSISPSSSRVTAPAGRSSAR